MLATREVLGVEPMDLFIRGAMRVLALVDAIRDKRASKIGFRLPVTRRPRAGSSLPNRWDRPRPEHFVDTRFRA
jgi:hypothetical protein